MSGFRGPRRLDLASVDVTDAETTRLSSRLARD
jgi:hypothetical protein